MIRTTFCYPFKAELFRIDVALKILLIFLCLTLTQKTSGQAPGITYAASPVAITPGTAVSIQPANTGGAVTGSQYFQVSTFAGSNSGIAGTSGYVNGTGTAALFNDPRDMAFDASNNLYVADYGNNAIRKITPAGVVTTFAGSLTGAAGYADGAGTSALFSSPVGLSFDDAGNLFVSDDGNGAIRKITPAGVVSTFYQTNPLYFNPAGLCFNDIADLLVAVPERSQILWILQGSIFDAIYDSAINGAFTDIKQDTAGNLYITDPARNEISKFGYLHGLGNSGGVIAGNYNATAFNLTGVGQNATFTQPTGIQVMPDGTVYVADLKNNDIRKISAKDTVSVLAGYVPLNGSGFPTQQPGYVDGAIANAQFNQPAYISADHIGNLYVSEWGAGGNRIRKIAQTGFFLSGPALPGGLKFDPATGTISGTPIKKVNRMQIDTVTAINASGTSTATITFTPGSLPQAPHISYATTKLTTGVAATLIPTNTGGAVPALPYGSVGVFVGSPGEVPGNAPGTDTSARFNFPQTMEMDAAGNLYVADSQNQGIRKVTASGYVNTLAGSGQESFGFQDGTASYALFDYPDGTAMDTSGNLYVADYNNNAIRKVTPAGVVTTFYTSAATFGPGGMCFDHSGNLVISAQDANQIWKITPAGVASVLAGTTTAGYVNGAAATARFNNPTDVKIDSAGNMYIADHENNAIRKITPAGIVTTVAGSAVSGNTPGYANGKGSAANFNNPAGILLAPGGVIYVTDCYNNDIRRVMPDGTVGLVAGSGTQATGDSDGIGTAAGFNLPVYMFLNDAGTGYISEFGGERIRKIVLTGYSLTGTLPAGLGFDPATGIISGTPTGPIIAHIDTITAYNTAGYSTTIITIPASNIATLANLVPGSGALNPAFVSSTTSYTDSVVNSNTAITIIPTATDSTATITVNDSVVKSGTPSALVPLTVGLNTITTMITAQDGTTTDSYTITVFRAPSSVATLSNLIVSHGALTPAFATGTTAYTDAVSNAIASVDITPFLTDSTSTITVNGETVIGGTASAAIPLTVGPNTITAVVTAQDGITTSTYRITVTRAPSSVVTLTELSISKGTLSPAFDVATVTYADSVANNVTSVTITPTLTDSTAKIMVNGNTASNGVASQAISLNPGNNTITVVITAQDSITTATYTVMVFVGSTMSTLDATNVLTPNGDGKNDYWLIKDIDLYPQNKVTIFDNTGRIVYKKSGYNNDWDGTLNGSQLIQGTYYYTVSLGPNLPSFKGFISIVRN